MRAAKGRAKPRASGTAAADAADDDVPLRLESDVFVNVLSFCMDVEGGFTFGGGVAVPGASLLDTCSVVVGEERPASADVDVDDDDADPQPCYFNAQAHAANGASDPAGRYYRGTACMCGEDLVCAAGVDLRYFEGADLTLEPVRFAAFAKPVLQVCSSADGARLLARSFEEVRVFVREGLGQVARVYPQLLGQSPAHTHAGGCHVIDASFGMRRDEVLWVLSCGLCLCTSLRSQATLVVQSSPADPLLACRNVGHSRRFVSLAPARVSVVDFTVEDEGQREVMLLRAPDNSSFRAVAVHPSHVHLIAVACADRTVLLDTRFPNAPLLSRAHVATSDGGVVALFFSDAERLVCAFASGFVALHRLRFGDDASVRWLGDVVLMRTALVECHTLLTGCCMEPASQHLLLSSLHGDVCAHPVGAPRAAGSTDFRRRALWRTLQPRAADAAAAYPFAAFADVVGHLVRGIPEQPCVLQRDAAAEALFEAVPSRIDEKGKTLLEGLRNQWEKT